MNLSEMENAVGGASATLNRVRHICNPMARLLRGRLREVDPLVLKELKRELQQFKRGAWA